MSLPFIHSFNNSTANNNILYADTSFVWESFGTSNGGTPSRQSECHNFSSNAVQQGSVFVISPIVDQELRNVALKELIKTHAPLLGLRNFQRKQVISNVPQIMAQAHNQVDQIMQILTQDPSFILLDSDSSGKNAHQLSSKYNMDLNDSIILATMIANEINSIVTLDGDYIEVHDKGINVYTNHANYLKILQDHPNKIQNGNNAGSSGTAS